MDDRKGNKKGIRGRLYIIALLAGILWTALPLGSFLYHYQDAQREIEQLVHNVAAEGAKKDMLYRFLVDELGGIYAPITEKNAPDPYLSNITDRDITTPSGKRLTLMSPDYLMRQSHETGKASGLVNGHITSLKPLRPENRPDEWEAKALRILEKGEKEFSEIVSFDGSRNYRFMLPLIIEKSCLRCHAAQGYKLGDLYGGISATVPMKKYEMTARSHIVSEAKHFGLIWTLGFISLILMILYIRWSLAERKNAEGLLQASERKYRNLFNNAEVGMFRTRMDGSMILDMNEKFLSIFDRTREEMEGNPSLIHWADPDEREEMIHRLKIDGCVTDFECKMLDRQGEIKFCLTSLRLNPEQNVLEGSIIDITERRRAEEALQRSESLYRLVVENINDIIWTFDLASMTYTFVSPSAERILGYADETMVKNLDVIFTPETKRHVLKLFGKFMEGNAEGNILVVDAEHRKKDGSLIWMEISASPLKDDLGNIVGFLGATRNITERKRAAEEKRSMAERLQRAEKMEALGQLAGGVAHDLNNVLGVLSGYSELLLLGIPEGSQSRGHVEKILQSTQKGAAIIEDLLTLARRGVTASDVIDLNSVVSGFLQTPVFEKMKDYHPHVTFRTECDKDLLNIKGSPVHLEKTLMNLVSNAAEAVSGKGEVTIRTESRYLDKPLQGYDEIKEGDYTVLTVSDTGMGIPTENRAKIFEPFYTKKTMGRSGTGLGLAIVWGTVKDHNGYIDVQTEVGGGTIFTLYFPVTREERIAPQQKEPIERYMGKGESVLVVDDIAEQRDVAAGLLTQMGYEVHVVSSGEEAVEYLKGNKADILVLDMIMPPGIDGLETYQRVLEINPRQKAIIVSGFSETDRAKEAQKLGAGAYVKKPYVMEKIGMAIRDELNR